MENAFRQNLAGAPLALHAELGILMGFRRVLPVRGSFDYAKRHFFTNAMARKPQMSRPSRRRSKAKPLTKKKDPIFVDGQRPRPMYVDYKDIELLKKLTNRQGKIISRRKSGCTAASQHAVMQAIKRARFMALLPYVGE